MNGRDILSWLLALAAVSAIVAGAFATLAACARRHRVRGD
jgi:hypothetical protein